ncbi:TPA: hypothetical protein DEP58_01835 [Patescibacteria group bacterium]|nr:MAG: Bifunctional protein FolD [Parcubacteria group bacterium GW2011_GWD2_42_14]HCC05029.1 hypothetical protein [Patescibacteria group bacterium]
MIIDGKLIAHDIKTRLKDITSEQDPHLSLGIVVTHETPAIRQFAALKQSFGKSIGVVTEILKLGPFEQKNEHLLQLIMHSTRKFDGIVLQLPIAPTFMLDNILSIFPLTHDVDVLGNTAYQQFKEGNLPFLPPVVGAFAEILSRSKIKLVGKKVLVIGEGRLVGGPSAVWARRLGAIVTVANKETVNLETLTQQAEVIMLGAGSPGLLKPDMIQEGVIILDAGSGEVAGVVQGDADQACAEKSALFTPTPGGVGPVTVAKLFENIVALREITHPRTL